MESFVNLNGTLREFWDENITREITAAGINVAPVPGCDSPQYHGITSLKGELGKWIFHRSNYTYMFWGDVPISMAKRIAQDPDCREGSMLGQWGGTNHEDSDCAESHDKIGEFVTWIAPDGFTQERDFNYSEDLKEALIHDANGRLRFMDDPSIGAEAFVRTYTFFTLAALKRFVEISNEERVVYRYTH